MKKGSLVSIVFISIIFISIAFGNTNKYFAQGCSVIEMNEESFLFSELGNYKGQCISVSTSYKEYYLDSVDIEKLSSYYENLKLYEQQMNKSLYTKDVKIPSYELYNKEFLEDVLKKYGSFSNCYEQIKIIYNELKKVYGTYELNNKSSDKNNTLEKMLYLELYDRNYIANADSYESIIIIGDNNYYDGTSDEVADELVGQYCLGHISECFEAEDYATLAENETAKRYNGWLHYDNGDAFRHSYWSALMSYNISPSFATELTCRHEGFTADKCKVENIGYTTGTLDYYDVKMDLENNRLGIEAGKNYNSSNSYYDSRNPNYGLAQWQDAEVINGKRYIVRKFTEANGSMCSQSNGQYYTGYWTSSAQCHK